jgi:trigger factor
LDELKKEIEKRITEVKESEAERNFKARVLKEVTDKAEVDIPDKLVDNEVEKMLAELDYELKGRGSNLDNYLGMVKKSIDEVKEAFKEEARMRVKSELTLEAVARAEGLKPTKEEIEKEIKELASRTSKDPTELRDVLQKSGNIKLVERELIFRKALNFLIESAKPVKIKDKAKKTKEEKAEEKKVEKESEKK